MSSIKQAHWTIKLAYLAWSLLYVIETGLQLYAPAPAVTAELQQLGGFVGPDALAEITNLTQGVSIGWPLAVIVCGWPFVVLLPKNHGWVFSTFVSSCFLSLAVSLWCFLFPDTGASVLEGRLLPLGYIASLIVMIRYAYRLKRAVREKELIIRGRA